MAEATVLRSVLALAARIVFGSRREVRAADAAAAFEKPRFLKDSDKRAA